MANDPLYGYCLLENENKPFKIEASIHGDVGDLKRLVQQARKNTVFRDVDATDLTLWQLHKPISISPFDTFPGRLPLRGSLSQHAAELKDPTTELSSIFPRGTSTHLSIIVVYSGTAFRNGERDFIDRSAELLQTWSTPIVTLPDVLRLGAHISMPLSEAEKVPISNYEYDRLLSTTWQSSALCTDVDLQMLFRRGTDEKAENLIPVIIPVIYKNAPEENGTESSFISFWDDNIRCVFRAIITQGQTSTIRDSNRDTSTLLQRPNFGLLTGGSCVFRGEEKPSSYAGPSPRLELTQKLVWAYDPAPYILGYYAIGVNVTLVAISPLLQLTVLAAFDLSYRRQRIAMMTHIIRLCSVIQALRSIVGARNFSEFSPICRDSGVVIEAGSTMVKKTYPYQNDIRISHLEEIYGFLIRKSVPNVDQLALSSLSEGIVYLKPRGLSGLPKLVEDVQDAVICVLQALVVMHAGPNPIFHRDIRWPNIVRHIQNPRKWFLIDWEDASTLPTYAASQFRSSEHSPQVFKDGHGAEVDIWAVGKLILDAGSFAPPLPTAMIAVGERMMSDASMSAIEAAQQINNILGFF